MNVAILSNVNVDSIIKGIGKVYPILPQEGYDNALEMLLNQDSNYYQFNPQITFLIIDVYELIKQQNCLEKYYEVIDEWFVLLKNTLDEYKTYFISDADCRGYDFFVGEKEKEKNLVEIYWNKHVDKICNQPNVFKIPYKKNIIAMGRQEFYNSKLWYLGKIPYSNKGQKILIEIIKECIDLFKRPAKKVLLLDLDNTLWGGVIGEAGLGGIELSEDRLGAIYKDFQRVLKTIKQQGIILTIVSKNNEKDALEVLRKHPHMILREEDFIIKKINWEPKHINIREIAKELNVGLDSMVFIDDHPIERESIRALLPEVTVPEFPNQIENLPQFAVKIYETHFKKLAITKEDKEKMLHYKNKLKRDELEKKSVSFESFLQSLDIKVQAYQNNEEHLERIYQLLNKTNQFNLTTKRYSRVQVQKMLIDSKMDIFTFEVKDKFGDNGIVSVVIIDKTKQVPLIDSFVMSCRVMGKWIENYIIEFIENILYKEGFVNIMALYEETSKNKPVKNFYKDMDYKMLQDNYYELNLKDKPVRRYFVNEGEN